MASSSKIKIIIEKEHEPLEKFAQIIKTSAPMLEWRCLYCAFSLGFAKDTVQKDRTLETMEDAFHDIENIKIFWLTSGHLFMFFKEPTENVIKKYEEFLKKINPSGQKIEYHFFGEISGFQSYFDESLNQNIKNSKSFENLAYISPALSQRRNLRFRPLILIVEDDRTTRHIIQKMLEKYCDIIVAESIGQAKKLYAETLPNMAFLDIELPDGNGDDLAEFLCKKDSESFIVMLSGSLSKKSVMRCHEAGVKGFLAKPVKEFRLLRFIDQYKNIKDKKLSA